MEEYLWDFSVYISLIGLVFLLFSFLTGMRIIKIKPKYKAHKKLAIAAFVTIMPHAFIMIWFYFFT